MRNRDAIEHMEAHMDICSCLKQRGFAPTLNMLDKVFKTVESVNFK